MIGKSPSRLNKYFYLARSYLKVLLTSKALSFPLSIHIQTKSWCNGNCVFCPYPDVHKQLIQGTMAKELFEKIVDELVSTKYRPNLLFELHNEPLLDERVFALIKYIKTRIPDIRCSLVTNGQLLDKFNLQEIKQSNIDHITVSLNAYSREMYHEVSGGLDFDRIINNISALISDENLKRKTVISFVLTQKNVEEVSRALRYWNSLGVKTRTVDLYNRAGAVTNYASLKLRTCNSNLSLPGKIGKFLIARIIGITGCYDPYDYISILFNGDVILCCDDWNRYTIVGNVSDNSIEEVWNSPSFNEARRLIIKKKYNQIASCKNCIKAK